MNENGVTTTAAVYSRHGPLGPVLVKVYLSFSSLFVAVVAVVYVFLSLSSFSSAEPQTDREAERERGVSLCECF
jgi:hypothetical protein